MNAKELGAQRVMASAPVKTLQLPKGWKTGDPIPQHLPEVMRYLDGLTKRELAAFMAMQGFVGYPPNGHVDGKGDDDDIARLAVRYADALLAELAKDQP